MSSKTTMLVSSPSRETLASDVVDVRGDAYSFPPSPRPKEILVVIDDAELEVLAKAFAMSPVRQAMTFEAYLAVKGLAQTPPRS
jgi:hypothetical protein